MSLGTFTPGEVVISTWVTAPASGSVALADVTARVVSPGGDITNLSGVAGAANNWTVQWTISDTATPGDWTLRWESNSPSAKLVKEVTYTVAKSPFGDSA